MRRLATAAAFIVMAGTGLVGLAAPAGAECVEVNGICVWNYNPPDTDPWTQTVHDTKAGGEAAINHYKEEGEDEGECEGGRRVVDHVDVVDEGDAILYRMWISDAITDVPCGIEEYRVPKPSSDPDYYLCRVGHACR